MKNIRFLLTTIAACFTLNFAAAQDIHLHINEEWEECSFQLDPSLTQEEWHQFTKEAGTVIYFRPLTEAKPMGAGSFELSILQWNTRIDESEGAWNNTFVHPDSAHWLIGDDDLPFPGLSLRAGITNKIDAGIYWTARPGANYGIAGGQLQYNFLDDTVKNWSASTRLSFNSLYGPEDLNLNVVGVDLLASKKINVISDWASISPYAGVSAYLSNAHEKTEAVELSDENISGVQGMVGAVTQIYFVQLAAEYNFANVNSFSYRLGFKINF